MKVLMIFTFMCSCIMSYSAEFISWQASSRPGDLRICQIDNPSEIGDIYIITAPDGTVTLLDCGELSTAKSVLIKALEKRNIRKIDQLIISHFHSDHVGGALTLLADPGFEIGSIICTFPPEEKVVAGEANALRSYRTLKMMAARRLIPWIELKAKDRINFGSNITAEVIIGSTNIADHNGQSLVFMLSYGDFRMLFTGDLSWAQEELVFKQDVDLHCDVLKLAHHGGAGSNSDKFIDAVSPTVAITCQPQWLARDARGMRVEKMMLDRNIAYFRSWEYGDTVLFTDGKTYGICRD